MLLRQPRSLSVAEGSQVVNEGRVLIADRGIGVDKHLSEQSCRSGCQLDLDHRRARWNRTRESKVKPSAMEGDISALTTLRAQGTESYYTVLEMHP
jgi:hypothetical protein